MVIHTRNTRYVLKDIGDGAFLIQGHPHYCPLPIKVELPFKPERGKYFIFIPLEGEREGRRTVTTEVQQIIED